VLFNSLVQPAGAGLSQSFQGITSVQHMRNLGSKCGTYPHSVLLRLVTQEGTKLKVQNSNRREMKTAASLLVAHVVG
jgi:hypothetical protein